MMRLTALIVLALGGSVLAQDGSLDRPRKDDSPQRGRPVRTRTWTASAPVAGKQAVASRRSPVRLQRPRAIGVRYHGAADAVAALKDGHAEPLSLASADFDEDGVPDLLCGFARNGKGAFTLHRGNIDSLYPHHPGARERKKLGTFVNAPFEPDAEAFSAPGPAEFIAAGDFDADGHWDVVTSSREEQVLHFFRGDGTGQFPEGEEISLPGKVTALAVGEMNRRDGLEDIAVAIEAPAGPGVLVFEGPEGALGWEPELHALPEPATSLVMGRSGASPLRNLVVGAGEHLIVIEGRDRRLTGTLKQRKQVPAAGQAVLTVPSPILSVQIGDFDGDTAEDIAVLSEDGVIRLTSFDRLTAAGEELYVGSNVFSLEEPVPGWPLTAGLSPAGGAPRWSRPPHLSRAIISASGAHDLIVAGPGLDAVAVRPGGRDPDPPAGAVHGTLPSPDPSVPWSLVQTGAMPVAVLPMRLNDDALNDLAILSSAPDYLEIADTTIASTFTVTTTSFTGPGSLREAIDAANANPGPDAIYFNIPGPGPHVITATTVLPIITESLLVDGTSEPDYTGAPVIVIDGSTVGLGNWSCLYFRGTGNRVTGLSIVNYSGSNGASSINLEGGVGVVDGSIIDNTYIDYLPSGQPGGGRTHGIIAETRQVLIGGTTSLARNVIRMGRSAVSLHSAQECDVYGNYLGANPAGDQASADPNSAAVRLARADEINVGGLIPGSGNVMATAMNLTDPNVSGIWLGWDATGNLMQGNFIGVAAGGGELLGYGGVGISSLVGPVPAGSSFNTVGGTSPNARNVIAGCDIGIEIKGSPSTLVQGNRIGTDVTGNLPLGNNDLGIWIQDSTDNIIGGSVPAAANIIGANGTISAGAGIKIDKGTGLFGPVERNTVIGNLIGTDHTGNVSIQNWHGVVVEDAVDTTIGGPGSGEGNLISGNYSAGVIVTGMAGSGTTIQGNRIGTTESGLGPLPNAGGIALNSASATLVGGSGPGERNVISGNGAGGISIQGATAGVHVVQGNLIGLGSDGMTPLGNNQTSNGRGVLIVDASGALIGGPGPGEGNLITDNSYGLDIFGPSGGHVVAGNWFGLASDGSTPVPNVTAVEIVDSSGNTIGGSTPTDRNVLAGGAGQILVQGATSTANVIRNNFIGLDPTGQISHGSNTTAVLLYDVSGNSIEENVIASAAASGVGVIGDNNLVQGNLIGTTADGSGARGNAGNGVNIAGNGNTVHGNLIAYNGLDGVLVGDLAPSEQNSIRFNALFLNGGLGIDLAPDGVTPNDTGDGDTGSNLLQNFPILSSAGSTGGSMVVTGSLNSSPDSTFDVDVYAVGSCDPTGYGEGMAWLGTETVTSDAAGNAVFSGEYVGPMIAPGIPITATATDGSGNTSELSPCESAVGIPPLPVAGLAIGEIAPDAISWDPEPGATQYHVYVGASPNISNLVGPEKDSCQAGVTTQESWLIPSSLTPPAGEFYWYLVLPEGGYGLAEPEDGSLGPRIHGPTGDCGTSCTTDKCVGGGQTNQACDPCVSLICEQDPSCCNTKWTSTCVAMVMSVCGLSCP